MSKPDPSAGGSKKSQARSVADLMQYVKQLPSISDETSIKAYYGASETLLQQAEGHEASGDSEREFVALMKYVTLLVEKLPKHKQYASAIGKQLKTDNSTKLKTALKRLEILRPLLQQAYEEREAEIRRLAEAEERLRRQREEAEKQRQQLQQQQRIADENAARAKAEAARAAEEAAKQQKIDADEDDAEYEEDDLLARARKLRLTNSNTPNDKDSDNAHLDSDGSDGELPALSPEELKAFEADLENQNADANSPASPLVALPDPHLDELFASGKVLGGIDAIGNSSVAKPDLVNVVVPGYAITVTPFTQGVLRPDVVENNPPLIDLSATTRQPTLMMMPSQPLSPLSPSAMPQQSEPHIMDLSTIPNPHSVHLSPTSPLLSFVPPPAAVTPPPAPVVAAAPVPQSQPTISAPSAPPLEATVAPTPTSLTPITLEALKPSMDPPKVVAAASKKPDSSKSSGDAMVMERPRKEQASAPESDSEKEDVVLAEPVSSSPKVSTKIPRSKAERIGELPPPVTEKKASPPVSKKVSFEDEVVPVANSPKKSSKKHKSKSSSSSSGSSRKYAVTPGVAEPDPADADPMLSITRTIRNKQYNPQEDPSLRPRLDAAPTGPTCTNDTPSSRQVPLAPLPQQMVMVPSHGHAHSHAHGHPHQHNHGHLQYARPLPGQPYYVPPPTQPQYVQMHNQQVPVVYSPFQNPQIFQNAQQVVYQPQSQGGSAGGGAVMPVMYGVPLSFRPQMLSIYGQTNKTNHPAVKSAEASAPPLLRSKELEDSSESSDEDVVLPKPTSKKPSSKGSSKASKASKTSKPKKEPPLIGGLRQIDIDGEIFDSFMRAAHPNTSREIETCGILCGRMNEDESGFSVTHLIVPKQTGTTDTCATTDEEEIFTYQMKKDLLTLGWIHTHPTQACFLSSVDLHTQASYQTLFPEAMAIVIAPKDQPNFSIFHLTNPGLMTVQSCPLKGFHLHDEIRLYEPCAHVRLRWGQKKYKLVDMR